MISQFAMIRRKPGGLFSHLAMAIALAGGAVVATSVTAPAAHAEDYSRGFVGAYEPVAALTAGDAPNWEAAKAQFESVVNSVKTDDDRNAAGNLALQIGNGSNDDSFKRRGLEMMLASGKVAPEQVGLLQFYVGSLAYNAGDYTAARTALQASLAAGYTDGDPRSLIVETYYQEDQPQQGIDYLLQQASVQTAAGQTVDENSLIRGLQEAYNSDLLGGAVAVSKVLVMQSPTPQNWINSLQVVNALGMFDSDDQAQLDMYRLMRETKALSNRQEYVGYIEAADPRIMANEVKPVLNEGLAAGFFDATDSYYVDVKSVADARAPQDRRNPDGTYNEGMNGDAIDAMASGEVLWSLGDFARAEELYQAAIAKGGDRDAALTRVGMAQVKQGKYAEAIANFAQVTGQRQPIAQMWAVYAEVQMGS